jgi:K+-transporting ATPase KdpF subunit
MRRIGAKEVTWAYILSGAISLALLVYLVIALIRAEDL